MSPISRKTAGGRAYIDLQRRAKDSRRNTQELIQLYVLEGFLARLSHSSASDKLVLKGGVDVYKRQGPGRLKQRGRSGRFDCCGGGG